MKRMAAAETRKENKINFAGSTATKSSAKARRFLWLLAFSVMMVILPARAAETPVTNAVPAKGEEVTSNSNSNSLELRTYLQLQEQIHSTQLAIERIRKEAAEIASQNNETLAARLQAIEQSLSAQRAHELDAMQKSNGTMLMVAGAFAGMGFVAMLLMGYFQWKTIKGLADVSTALPTTALQLGAGPSFRALGSGADHGVSPAVAEASPALLESIQRLEQRLRQLEHPADVPSNGQPVEVAVTEEKPKNGSAPNGSAASTEPHDAAETTVLLSKGQSLLNMEKAEEALACFNSVLAIEPNHPDALVKKGAALEKLRKLNEAIECYDRAIAADSTLTIAYLYKGGVFNRMEKFSEALECYEQALRTQEKRRG